MYSSTACSPTAPRSSFSSSDDLRPKSEVTVLFYKFPQLNREELERMFNLAAIRDTAVYREAFSEGKLDAVPLLLELGATEERIAAELGLDLQAVRQAAARARGQRRGSGKARPRRSPKTTE